MKNLVVIIFLLVGIDTSAQPKPKTENVILITLDGFRWQEMFTGAEKRLITDKSFVTDSARAVTQFWAEDPAKRRVLLLPFLWSTVSQQGQLYGNRLFGNWVNVTNNQWFSYPGYNEILTGFSDNERIHSNDKIENPNKTVFELLNQQEKFRGKVAVFTSWDVFPYILNAKRSGLYVNSGLTEATGVLTEREKVYNELMREVLDPLGDVRLDAFTFRYGLEYLKKNRPRILYLSFDETDDLAHHGNYDLMLEAAHHIDEFVKTLWEWVQSTPGYRDKTTLILTTDHGRGNRDIGAWRNHGANVEGADEIWMAVLGPDTPPLGEVRAPGQLYQNQVAATLAAFVGVTYVNERPAGAKISSAFAK
jgi:hypothetical protein